MEDDPPGDLWAYWNIMSEAMATLCNVKATVMTTDINNIDESGIWGQTEKKTLQRTGNTGGRVDTVSLFSVLMWF
jgi:hypothetical protein